MIKEVVSVKMPEDFKEKAMLTLDETIEKVLSKTNTSLTEKEKRKIKNLSLDQVNINTSKRSRSKSIWVFDTETHIPVSVRTDKKLKSAEKHSSKNPECNYFKVKNNLTWTYEKTNAKSNESLNKKEFEDRILEIMMEDFETAAFYGTLSYVKG